MTRNIREFRLNLLNKIGGAESERSIKRYISTAVRSLVRSKVHGHLIVRFLERSMDDLQSQAMEHSAAITGLKLERTIRQLQVAKQEFTRGVAV